MQEAAKGATTALRTRRPFDGGIHVLAQFCGVRDFGMHLGGIGVKAWHEFFIKIAMIGNLLLIEPSSGSIIERCFVCILIFAAMVIFNDLSKLNLFARLKP